MKPSSSASLYDRVQPAPRKREEWYEDRGELFAFAEAFAKSNSDCLDTGVLFYLLRHPWKWSDEYLAWVADGRPDYAPRADA